jgi:hypothetical protein
MRGQRVLGRFDIDYEALSIYEGINDDLRAPVGDYVDWWVWDQEHLEQNFSRVVDDIYDTSRNTRATVPGEVNGRKWKDPFKMPVVMTQLIRGANVMNERGFYVVDTLRIIINIKDVNQYLPEMLPFPEDNIRDRIVYNGQVFSPTRLLPRGRFDGRYAVVTVDCNEVKAEELVNDAQFQQYALEPPVDYRTPPPPEDEQP